MLWMFCETNLVLYAQTLEGALDKWGSGQAVLYINPDVLVSKGSGRSYLPPGEEVQKEMTCTVLLDVPCDGHCAAWCSGC